MRVRLTPSTANAGGTKVFEVVAANLQTTNGQLTLTCRDGRVCLGLIGSWECDIDSSPLMSMSCDEVERIHDGKTLVTTY